MTSFGLSPHITGIPIVLSDTLEDGVVMFGVDPACSGSPIVCVGTRRRSWAHDEAIRIVRTGLADWCARLGIPQRPPTHEEVLARLGFPASGDAR